MADGHTPATIAPPHKTESSMINAMSAKFAEARARKRAFESLPAEAVSVLNDLRAEWLLRGKVEEYELVRNLVLTAWSK